MSLKPDASLAASLAVMTLVYAVYSGALPPIADVRASDAQDPTIAGTEQVAAWGTAGIVAGISIVTKDPNIFILGGSMVIFMSWWHKHANQVNPMTGKATVTPIGSVNGAPTPEYADAA